MRLNWRKRIVGVCLALGISVGAVHAQEKVPQPKVMEPALVYENGSAPLSQWYVQGGAVVLRRSVGSNAVLVTNAAGTAVLSTSRDFDFNWAAGPQILMGRKLDEDTAVEFNYFGVYDMNSSLTFAGPGRATGSPFVGTDFFADYRSSMTSVELNARRWLSCELSVLAGFRFVNWHEDLSAGFTIPAVPAIPPRGVVAVFPGVPGTPAIPTTANIITNNNLWGAQVGANWESSLTDRFGVEAFGKAGVYGNEAFLRARSVVGTTAATLSRTRCQAAFLGELGILGSFKVNDRITVRAGYTAMWLEGIALAPDQLGTISFTGGTTSVNSNGGVLLHGAVANLEFRW